ncbi:hypothetical protein M422DRAFT_265212 [Sphaerobolus stellatus SS14]|uniref:Uncharacterized protein n=1 Tax=Sphaerobolus stellatus (strain SS14) TaxID=990650 RepID=A0A0C9UDU4_SPHS4|nr:hypothetical protein M422DRAFT_265212 [Sphaerobolus stellatus SS14]
MIYATISSGRLSPNKPTNVVETAALIENALKFIPNEINEHPSDKHYRKNLQEGIVPCLTIIGKGNILNFIDLLINPTIQDELESDEDNLPSSVSTEGSKGELSDTSTESDIPDSTDRPWEVPGSAEFKKQYEQDWFALPLDCSTFPDITFPKAQFLDTTLIKGLRWTKNNGSHAEFIKVRYIDSPWTHLCHYIDWESYGFDLRLIRSISIPMETYDEHFSVFWKPSRAWYDTLLETSEGIEGQVEAQEIVVLRHNLALPGLFGWIAPSHQAVLNAWMEEYRNKFW